MMKFVILSSLMLLYSTSYADVESARHCSEPDVLTSDDVFQNNLSVLLNMLSLRGPGQKQKGFYTGKVGKGKDKIYGLVQCRGDVSTSECYNCTQESIKTALQNCPKSRTVRIWIPMCFLHYSDENFLGVWDQSSTAVYNDTDIEDASVLSKGISLMCRLTEEAPRRPLKFQTAMLDAGENGKRYALAQCTRDISRSDCGECLDSQLDTFRTTIGSKRNWEIYGTSCSMWYHDFKFYSSSPTSLRSGAGGSSSDGPSTCVTMAVLMLLVL